MRKYWVYVHTCPNGKRYVGITTRIKPEYRWAEGRGYQCNDHFSKAILKYGWNNITHEVFEVDSAEEMYRKEVELISFYHSNDPEYGYNLSSGGEKSSLGCKHSEEYKKKQSEASKKKWSDPGFRKKVSEAVKKGCSNPEVQRKRSEANKKKWADPEYRRKMSEAQKGKPHKPHSEETKRKMSEAAKKKWSDTEYRKHKAEAAKERAKDPEYRKKLSEAKKGKVLSEETKRRISETLKGKPHKPFSEETKRRMSEAKKGKPKPRVKIKLPDGTIIEMTKNIIVRDYVNKGKKFEYVF